MKIYKFKDLREESKHSHFTQIILESSIWCARPDSLNDENEFEFKLDYEPSSNTLNLLIEILSRSRTTNYVPPVISASWALSGNNLKEIAEPIVDSIVNQCRDEIGIISFSSIKSGEHLWDEYGGKGYGVFVEIDIPDELMEKSYYSVHYEKEKIFHVDSFFESALFPNKAFETYRNMLLTKTEHKWKREEEIRFIGNRQDVNVKLDGYVSGVTFGSKVPESIYKELVNSIKEFCSSNCIKISRL